MIGLTLSCCARVVRCRLSWVGRAERVVRGDREGIPMWTRSRRIVVGTVIDFRPQSAGTYSFRLSVV